MKNKINIPEVNFRNEFLDLGFEIVSLSYLFTVNEDYELQRPHRINFFAILFITEGKGLHTIDFNEYSYKRHDILFIGSEQIHSWSKYKGVEGFVIFFTEDFLQKNQTKFKDVTYSYPYNSVLYKPVVSVKDKYAILTFTNLINYIYNEYNQQGSEEKQEILQCLLRTFLLKIRVHNRQFVSIIQNDKTELFIRFQSLLTKNIASSRNAKDYCKWLNVSYKKLNNTCKELTNKSLKFFIDSFLILKAKQYLTDGDKNVSEVAYLLGFNEITNFTKYFTKHSSQNPSTFQSSLKKS